MQQDQPKAADCWFQLKLGVLLFLAIFFPYIKLAGHIFPTLILSHIAIALVFLLRLRLGKFELSFVLYSLVSLVFISVLSVLKLRNPDLRLILLFMYLPILSIAARAVAEYEFKRVPVGGRGVLHLVFAFHSLVIVLLNIRVISPDFLYGIIYIDPKVFTYPIERYPGFAYDSFSYISVLQAFGFCLLLNSFSKKPSLTGFLLVLISFASVVVSGRAGIVVVAAFVIQRVLLFDLRVMGYGLVFCLALILAFAFDWGSFDWYKSWAFSFIVGFFSGEGVSDSSALELRHHVFFPDNWLVGDRVAFLDVKSDLGFIRIVNSYGLVGGTIFFSFYIMLIFFCYRVGGGLPLFFVLSLCALNLKDVYLIAPYGHFFLIFYLCSVCTCRGKNYVG